MTQPTLTGLHHVTLPVADIQTSIDWYEAVLRAERVARLDTHDATGQRIGVVLRLPGLTVPVKLALAPESAAVRSYDPVTLSVADVAELRRWAAHFDACGAQHTPITAAHVGSSVTFADPDGTPLRLYYTDPAAGLDDVLPPET